jgi:hypothetical protein
MLGRDRLKAFAAVAAVVSLGTAATLVEPWIYRSIIDDIAGVFVAPPAVVKAETVVERGFRSLEHLGGSVGRMLRVPMAAFPQDDGPSRTLERRTVHEAAATVLLGTVLLVAIRLTAEWLRVLRFLR